jgi:tRNA (guanine37-N1)-methyltransferase
MRISIVTLFPEFFEGPLGVSIVGRAIDAGLVEVDLVRLRDHGLGPHRQVDDAPFGGGAGMVMMIEPLDTALAPLADSHRVLLTPGGAPLTQGHLDRFADLDHLTLVCGRFEGVDERVAEHLVDEEVSLGDFVLAGGEVAALAVVEGVARLVPGVVGNPESTETESFRDGLLEEPQYTRPSIYRGWEVPEILLSGDHGRVAEWRRERRIERTRQRRLDLYEEFVLGDDAEYDPAAPDGSPRTSEGIPDEHA